MIRVYTDVDETSHHAGQRLLFYCVLAYFGNNGVSGKGNSKYEGNSNCRTSYSYSGETYNDVNSNPANIIELTSTGGATGSKHEFSLINPPIPILRDNNFYFLEINTNPGLTKESILPQQALSYGISLEELFFSASSAHWRACSN